MINYVILCFVFSALHAASSITEDLIEERIQVLHEIQQRAQHTIWYDHTLSSEQLHLLLNMTCVSFALVNTTHKLQQEARFILHSSFKARYRYDDFLEHSDHLHLATRSFERFNKLLKALHILRQSYEELDATIALEEHKPIADIIAHVSHDAQGLVQLFSHQEEEKCNTLLHDKSTTINNNIATISALSRTFSTLANNTYPFETQKEKNIQKVALARHRIQEIMPQQVQLLIEDTESVMQFITDIESFGSLAFYIYYKVTFDGMKKHGLEDRYFTPLFEENCMICVDAPTKTLKEPVCDTNSPLFDYAKTASI